MHSSMPTELYLKSSSSQVRLSTPDPLLPRDEWNGVQHGRLHLAYIVQSGCQAPTPLLNPVHLPAQNSVCFGNPCWPLPPSVQVSGEQVHATYLLSQWGSGHVLLVQPGGPKIAGYLDSGAKLTWLGGWTSVNSLCGHGRSDSHSPSGRTGPGMSRMGK